MNSNQYKILAAKVDSQNKYWKKNGGVSNETVADTVIALKEAASNVDRIAELEKALGETNVELSGAIDQVNHFFEYHHPSNSLDEPERWDKQTCFENQVLLKEQVK